MQFIQQPFKFIFVDVINRIGTGCGCFSLDFQLYRSIKSLQTHFWFGSMVYFVGRLWLTQTV